ncbi:MAG: hypothetical protein ACRCV0_02760, partial [Brevinema sp.]
SYLSCKSTNEDASKFVDKNIIQVAQNKSSQKNYSALIKKNLNSEQELSYFLDHINSANPQPFDTALKNALMKYLDNLMSKNREYNSNEEFLLFIDSLLNDTKNYFENNTNEILKVIEKTRTDRLEKDFKEILLAYIYHTCKNNDIDISKEPESAGGRIDIKMSRGSSKKVVIEVKLSSHKDLVVHYNNQLKAYKEAENAFGYYLIFDIDKAKNSKEIDLLRNHLNKGISSSNQKCIIINAKSKITPSKRKNQDLLFFK